MLAATAMWVTRAAWNLVTDLQDVGTQTRFLISDRDGNHPDLFDAVLSDLRMPRNDHRPPPRPRQRLTAALTADTTDRPRPDVWLNIRRCDRLGGNHDR